MWVQKTFSASRGFNPKLELSKHKTDSAHPYLQWARQVDQGVSKVNPISFQALDDKPYLGL